MEFDWEQVALAVAGSGVVATLIAVGYKMLKSFVAKTENKLDDAVLKAFEEGLEQGRLDAERGEAE